MEEKSKGIAIGKKLNFRMGYADCSLMMDILWFTFKMVILDRLTLMVKLFIVLSKQALFKLNYQQ